MADIDPAGGGRRLIEALILLGGLAASAVMAQTPTSQTPPSDPLAWAYPMNTPGVETPRDDGLPKRVPGSNATYRTSDIDLFNPPDWHPDGHPRMPQVVSSGRKPKVFACGFCHLPDGQGRPENASLAGLPAEYIMQQIRDYKAGLRNSSVPEMPPPAIMKTIAGALSEEDLSQAADYFSGLHPRQWIRVVETDAVPANIVIGWMYTEKQGGGTESIGNRILEMPEDFRRTELRDDRSGFVAYVPPGSVARGRELVLDGGNTRTEACAGCHGQKLQGLGPVPPLAGRSPTYLSRQLHDFKTGARHGLWSPLMGPVVEKLTPADIVSISAYVASLDPAS